jgi:hypothetical protein
MRWAWAWLVWAGCGEPSDPPQACTDLAAASVSLTVVDAAGDPVADAVAEWSVDGGAWSSCDAVFEPGSFACGWEVSGTLSISVTADGYADWSDDVVVGMDAEGCHVVGAVVTAVLEASTDPTTTPTTPADPT